jgi:predicted DNA binding protein
MKNYRGFEIIVSKIEHFGDWTQLTEDLPSVFIDVFQLTPCRNNLFYATLKLYGNSTELNKLGIKLLDRSKEFSIKKIENITYSHRGQQPVNYISFYKDMSETTITNLIAQVGFLGYSTFVREGYEYWLILSQNQYKTTHFINSLHQMDVEVNFLKIMPWVSTNEVLDAETLTNFQNTQIKSILKSKTNFGGKSGTTLLDYLPLTRREREILDRAFWGGSFDINRSKSLTQIAKELDISVPYVAKALRSAIRKILSGLYF